MSSSPKDGRTEHEAGASSRGRASVVPPPVPSPLVRALVTPASLVTSGFGAWHFFVPSWYGWYDAIAPEATELVLAVRAINALFSLCLVLFGAIDLVLVWRRPAEPFALGLLLGASTLLWVARIGLQIAHPQGTEIPGVSEAMLAAFVLTGGAFAAAWVSCLRSRAST